MSKEATTIDRQIIRSYAKSLQDFGYSLTDDWVQGEADRLARGERPGGGPSTMIDGWLQRHGLKEPRDGGS